MKALHAEPDTLLRVAIAGVLAGGLLAGLSWLVFGVDLAAAPIFPPCPFRAVTGVPCPGCGMTRAFLLLFQLRFGEAFAQHPAAPALLAAMGIARVRRRTAGSLPPLVTAAAVVGVLGLWAVRLAGAPGGW